MALPTQSLVRSLLIQGIFHASLVVPMFRPSRRHRRLSPVPLASMRFSARTLSVSSPPPIHGLPARHAGTLSLTTLLRPADFPPTRPHVPRDAAAATTDVSVAVASPVAAPHDPDACPPHAKQSPSARSAPMLATAH